MTLIFLVAVIVTNTFICSSSSPSSIEKASSMTVSSYLSISLSPRGSKRVLRPFSPPKQCSLTENELLQIDDLLQSFDDNVKSDNANCDNLKQYQRKDLDVHGLAADRCNQLKGSITNNVNDLKIIFQCLKITGDNDSHYRELKVTYEKKISELQQQVSTLEKEFEQKFKKNIGDLKEQFNELQLEMNHKLEELRKERLHRQEANMKLLLEYLENGKIQSAWITFKDKLMEHSTMKIITIVKSAIGKKFGTNITTENLIKFTEGLRDDADAMTHGAIQLFKELEHKQALDVETVHILHLAVENIINTCKDLEGTDFETLKLILDEDTVDQVIHLYNKLEFLLKHVHHQP